MRIKRTVLSLIVVAPLGCRSGPAVEVDEHSEHGDEESVEHGDEESEIALDQHVIERNGIKTETARRRLLLGSLQVPAEVQINPDKTAHISSLVPGRLAEIRVALGDPVRKGDVLATVESVELGRARADLRAARAQKIAADAEVRRMSTLVDEGIAAKKSRVEADARADRAGADLAAARSVLSVYGLAGGSGPTIALESPLGGTVIERHASPGEIVDRDTRSFVVADLSQLWVMGRVYEQDLSRVAEGVPAEVALIAYPGRTWEGVVDYVSSTLDEDTRSVAIRVVLDNPQGVLRPGMFGTIALGQVEPDGETRTEVLSVPDTAVSTIGDRTVVFVTGDEPGSFRVRDVVPGVSAHGLVEIREGLQPDEEVVSHGAFVLKSEFSKASIGEGHAH